MKYMGLNGKLFYFFIFIIHVFSSLCFVLFLFCFENRVFFTLKQYKKNYFTRIDLFIKMQKNAFQF